MAIVLDFVCVSLPLGFLSGAEEERRILHAKTDETVLLVDLLQRG